LRAFHTFHTLYANMWIPNARTLTALQDRAAVPEIDGSEGGFIGLVVGLGVIIVVCCGVVFYLLKTQKRQPRPDHGYSDVPGSSSGKGLTIKDIFSFGGGQKRRNAGWTQQVDDAHDFDSDSEPDDNGSGRRGIKLEDKRRRDNDRDLRPQPSQKSFESKLPAIPQEERYPGTHHDMSSISSVSLQVPGAEDTAGYTPDVNRSMTESPPSIELPERKGTGASQFTTKSTGTKFREDISDGGRTPEYEQEPDLR